MPKADAPRTRTLLGICAHAIRATGHRMVNVRMVSTIVEIMHMSIRNRLGASVTKTIGFQTPQASASMKSHIVLGRTKPKTVMIRVDAIAIAMMDIHGQLLLKQIRPCGQTSV